MSKRRDAVARWRELVRGQAGSGLSVAAYCRRARVPQSSFYAWRRKLGAPAASGRRPADPGFAEVRVFAPAAPVAADALEVRLASGRGIVVRPGFERATLLALIDALERAGAGEADV
jgi:transposase-like protein